MLKLFIKHFWVVVFPGYLFLNSVSLAQNASSEPSQPVIRPTFFEEERKLRPNGFADTFLLDALNGVADPLNGTGTSVSSVSRPMPNVPDSVLLNSLQASPANLDVDSLNRGVFGFPGELNTNGGFTTTISAPDFSFSTPLSFNVGTTTFIVNQPIGVKGEFIDAGFADPLVNQILQSLGITPQNADSEIRSATVTPKDLPRGPVLSGINGGFIMGPVPDR
jgi:hypothetical protein